MENTQNNADPQIPTIPASDMEDGKTIAIISYLTLIGLVVAFVMNSEKKNNYAKFHIRQSLGIMLTSLATMFVSWIPFIGWLIGIFSFLFLLFLWITGLMNALNGKEKVLPILGNKYAEWFKSL